MSSRATLQSDLDLATDAVLAAGAKVRERFRDDPEVSFKSPNQPVTEADLIADDLLKSRLLGARGGYGWLSEETGDSPERLSRSRVWVVDPIDGTNSFVAGIPEFVVSVGLVEEGITVAAVVYNPISDELYRAVRGHGATRGEEAIVVAPAPQDGERPVLLGSRWEIEEGVLRRYERRWQLTAMGSTAYRMLKVADGTGHAFVSPARKNEWDICAAALVVTEAGGRVGSGTGAELRFNREAPVVQGIMAWSPAVRPEPPTSPPPRQKPAREEGTS